MQCKPPPHLSNYHRPVKLRESNVFSSVCLSVCSGDGWSQTGPRLCLPLPHHTRTSPHPPVLAPALCSNLFNLDVTMQLPTSHHHISHPTWPWSLTQIFKITLSQSLTINILDEFVKLISYKIINKKDDYLCY